MRIKARTSIKEIILLLFFYILVFQSPLGIVVPAFNYVDELTSLVGIGIVSLAFFRSGRIKIKKVYVQVIVVLFVFVLIGLFGNVLFKYQPAKAVLVDLFTNVKFFLSILTGHTLCKVCSFEENGDVLNLHARAVSLCLFLLLLIDLFFGIFPSPEQRYGIRVIQLFFFNPTDLAGSMAFLLSIFLLFYQNKNKPFMIMCLSVMFFTLRSKAIAGAIVYILILYFIVIYRKKIKLVHILIIAGCAIAVAWEQITYYYFDLAGVSARSALTLTSFKIMMDYFPIGTGFGTFASSTAIGYYSPVYYLYGINNIYGLSESFSQFGSDTFWPIIFGQTGAAGTVCYIFVLVKLLRQILSCREKNLYAYATGIFIFSYLMICSSSEPAFNKSTGVQMAIMIGIIIWLKYEKNQENCE